MNKRTFVKNTALMTVTSLLLRTLGIVFRLILSGRLGAQGMGLYQLLSPVLSLSFSLTAAGYQCFGGENSPYVWMKAPNGMGSWEFFDLLLDKANVASTPGAGFGPSGEGYVRLTAFGDAQATKEAVERIKALR